jgi:hypothetical protein
VAENYLYKQVVNLNSPVLVNKNCEGLMIEDYNVFIRSGLGGVSVSAKRPVSFPVIHRCDVFNRRFLITKTGSTEEGMISKDQFLIDFEFEIEFIINSDEESVMKYSVLGGGAKEILEHSSKEAVFNLVQGIDSNGLNELSETIENLTITLKHEDFESVKVISLKLSRTPLDKYNLDNVLHFKMAKEIVTQITRGKFTDKDFIGNGKRTIDLFEIVDE